RSLRFVTGPQRSPVPRHLGVPRCRDAIVPVRRRVCRTGAGRAVSRTEGHLVSDAAPSVRLVGGLGGRPSAGRTTSLAADPRRIRDHQSGRLLAAALVRARATRIGPKRWFYGGTGCGLRTGGAGGGGPGA